MKNKIQPINFRDYKTSNINDVEVFYDSLSKIVADSIVNNTTECIKAELEEITYNYEKIYNILELDDLQKSLCYYFGMISSLTDLALNISNERTKKEDLNNILDNYELLLPTLNIICRHGTISGSKLREELEFKNDSSLTNFMKRIKKYSLIDINKIGTSNYYTLSTRGKQLIESYRRKSNRDEDLKICFSDFIYFLNGLPEELEEDCPNVENIIHNYTRFNMNQREKRVLKQKLDAVFTTRDNYVKSIIQREFRDITIRESVKIRESYNDKADNIMYDYDYIEIDEY